MQPASAVAHGIASMGPLWLCGTKAVRPHRCMASKQRWVLQTQLLLILVPKVVKHAESHEILHLGAVVLLRFQAGQCSCGLACCCAAAKLRLPQAILVGAYSLVLRIAGAAQPADHCVWLVRVVQVAITKRPSDDHATWMGPPAELYSAML